MSAVSLDDFLQLPDDVVAGMVRASGPQVCVFPFNGTRRWYLLEHGQKAGKNFVQDYIEKTTRGYIQTYRLLFQHGIDTVLAPVLGSEILSRGEEYMEQIGGSMELLATHHDFLSFYEEQDIRVHFYGDFRRELKETKHAHVPEKFDALTRKTADHQTCRLFYGVFASDATESIAELSVEHYRSTGKIPTRREIIEAYYGEYVDRASIFIGFEKFTVFDYPMLNWGEESLYFTAAPSLYMTASQLRNILYDHIYLRPVKEPNYSSISKEELDAMQGFYLQNKEITFGIGELRNGIWYEKTRRCE